MHLFHSKGEWSRPNILLQSEICTVHCYECERRSRWSLRRCSDFSRLREREREREREAMRAQFFGWRRLPSLQDVADHEEINGYLPYWYGVQSIPFTQDLPCRDSASTSLALSDTVPFCMKPQGYAKPPDWLTPTYFVQSAVARVWNQFLEVSRHQRHRMGSR